MNRNEQISIAESIMKINELYQNLNTSKLISRSLLLTFIYKKTYSGGIG
jgi:hypothetical protein